MTQNEAQALPLEERFDVCDEAGRPTGETVSRSRAHREGIPHRTAHVWIVRERGGHYDILLQKRSRDKDSFPGLYDTSSAGHIPAGDEPLPSALRELREELGLELPPEALLPVGKFAIAYEKEFHGALFRDNEIIWLYLCAAPVDETALRLQPEEVEEVRWFDLREVAEEIPHSRERFCVPCQSLDLLRAYLDAHGLPAQRA